MFPHSLTAALLTWIETMNNLEKACNVYRQQVNKDESKIPQHKTYCIYIRCGSI